MIINIFSIHAQCQLRCAESLDRKSIEFFGDEILTRVFVIEFSSISELESAVVHEGITGVSDSAFQNFEKLKNISLPTSCRSLGVSSFERCILLKEVNLPEGLIQIGSSCFYNSGLVNISLPSSFTSELTGYVFYSCNSLKSFFVASNNSVYSTSEDHSILIREEVIAYIGFGDSKTIEIPPHVEEIAPYFLNGRSKINEIRFSKEGNLKRIQEMAFRNTAIKKLTLPQGLINITNIVPRDVTLEYVFFPKSLENVGDFFVNNPNTIEIEEGCKAVKVDASGIIYDKTGHSMLYLPSIISDVVIDSEVTYVMADAIRGNKAISYLSVVSNHSMYASFDNVLYSQYHNTLYACPGGLSSITVHFNCTSIASNSFESTWIREIDMSNCTQLRTVNSRAFCYAKNLTSIIYPDSVVTISSLVMYGSGIQSVVFPLSLTSLGNDILYNSPIKKLNFTKCEKLIKLNGKTFESCKELEECILPPNIQTLGDSEFINCVMLKKISLPKNLLNISESNFDGCAKLSEVKFEGSKIESIPLSCFSSCNLTSLLVPNSVKVIESEAMKNNQFLKEIIFGEESELEQIMIDAFAGCKSIEKIELKSKFRILSPGGLSHMNNLLNITVSKNNPYFSSKNGVLYNKDYTELVSFPGGLQEFEIDSSVKSIASRAFFGCSNLYSLNFSKSSRLLSIGSYTFYGCSNLVDLVIPSSVQEIDPMAFGGCLSIERVTFAVGSNLTEINTGVFSECQSLKSVIFNKGSNLRVVKSGAFKGLSNLEEFIAEGKLEEVGEEGFSGCKKLKRMSFENIIKIGQSAFMDTAIEKLSLSPSLEMIGRDAFRGCSLLEMVTYCGPYREELVEVEALTGFQGLIYVSLNYKGERMFCFDVIHSLDDDCKLGSNKFTMFTGSASTNYVIFASQLSSPPSECDEF